MQTEINVHKIAEDIRAAVAHLNEMLSRMPGDVRMEVNVIDRYEFGCLYPTPVIDVKMSKVEPL